MVSLPDIQVRFKVRFAILVITLSLSALL